MGALHPREVVRSLEQVLDVQVRSTRSQGCELLRSSRGRAGIGEKGLRKCLNWKRVHRNPILIGEVHPGLRIQDLLAPVVSCISEACFVDQSRREHMNVVQHRIHGVVDVVCPCTEKTTEVSWAVTCLHSSGHSCKEAV